MSLQDLSAKFAGIIFGLTNGLSGIVESLSIYGTGLILDSHHSWPLVFEIVASVSIAGGPCLSGTAIYQVFQSAGCIMTHHPSRNTDVILSHA